MKANQKAKEHNIAVAPVLGTLLVLPIIMLIITAMMTWAEGLIDQLKDLQDSVRKTTNIYNELSINLSHFKDKDIIWQDGYECDFDCSQWILDKSNPDSNMSVGPTSGGEESYFTGTLGANITTESGYTRIHKPFPTKNLGKVSIELKFTIDEYAGETFKFLNISQNDTDNIGSIKIDIQNNKIYCWNESTTNGVAKYETIANDVPLLKDKFGWHTIVLKIDLSKSEYISLDFDGTEYNIDNCTIENNGNPSANAEVTRISYTNIVRSKSTSFIDDFVFRDLEFFEKLGLE